MVFFTYFFSINFWIIWKSWLLREKNSNIYFIISYIWLKKKSMMMNDVFSFFTKWWGRNICNIYVVVNNDDEVKSKSDFSRYSSIGRHTLWNEQGCCMKANSRALHCQLAMDMVYSKMHFLCTVVNIFSEFWMLDKFWM